MSDPDAAARSAPQRRRVSAIFGAAPERVPPADGAREASRAAGRDAHGAGKARLHSARPQPAETNLLREAHVDR